MYSIVNFQQVMFPLVLHSTWEGELSKTQLFNNFQLEASFAVRLCSLAKRDQAEQGCQLDVIFQMDIFHC